ncbi:MAG: N-acetylglucosamine-6-phosphate deacetylase [Acidobacteriaceae bacterium]
MSTHSIAGRNIFTGQPTRITIQDGLISRIEDLSAQDIHTPPNQPDQWLAPGFIDLQVNGYAGFDLNQDPLDVDTVISLTHRLLTAGTTTFLPTLITASEHRIVAALTAIDRARQSDPLVAHAIPFVHLEGPHISPQDGPRGAHPRKHVRPPDLAEVNRWQQSSHNLVGLVTLSPHWQHAPQYIAALTQQGVRVSIGHTHASPEQIHRAVDAGATLSTHLGNGVSTMLPRHPNLLWAQLADDRLTATFIADGHHLPADTLRSMLRAKGIQRSVLVSDSVALAGMPPGNYTSPIGGAVELHPDGRLCMAGSDILAGSASSLADDLAWLLNNSVCSLPDAFLMATSNPGRFISGRGLLLPGTPADILSLSFHPTTAAICLHTVFTMGVEHPSH